MRPLDALDGWLPIDFKLSRTRVSVKWMEFGSKPLSEPFFNQTLDTLRTMDPPANEWESDARLLITKASLLEPVTPAGLIFHASRCGSTLLSNAFRTAERTVVLSEARPAGIFFQPDIFKGSPFPAVEWSGARRMLLDSVVSTFAHSEKNPEPRLVIKCNAANILQISLVRSVWPHVPSVVVVRDPVEIIMSILNKPAGWVGFKDHPAVARRLFGWNGSKLRDMNMEEYCARVIGKFFESAIGMIDERCRVIDYQTIGPSHIYQIAEFFNLQMPSVDSDRFKRVISVYSKDQQQVLPFEGDRESKQRKATELIRIAAQRWAEGPYRILTGLEKW